MDERPLPGIMKLMTVVMSTTGKTMKCLDSSGILHCVSKYSEHIRTNMTRYLVLKENGNLGVYRTTQMGRICLTFSHVLQTLRLVVIAFYCKGLFTA